MTTTVADLLAWDVRQPVVVAELEPSITLTGWTAVDSPATTYRIACPRFEPYLDGRAGGVYRPVIGVRENGTDLTARADLVSVEAHAGSYWWDEAHGLLYVRSTTDASPDTFSAYQAFVRLRLSTLGVVVDVDDDAEQGVYCLPWLTGQAPTSQEALGSDLFGVKITTGGELQATNGHGFWFPIVAPDGDYNWKNKRIRFLLGGSVRGATVAYTDFEPLATMLVQDVACDDQVVRWTLAPLTRLLDQPIPKTAVDETTYANVSDDAKGKHLPIGYGRTTLEPLLVDTATDQGVYAIADPTYQTLYAVHTVWAVAKSGGAKTPLSVGTDYAVDLTACTVRVVNATYTADDYTLLVDVTGKPGSASPTVPLLTFSEIVQDLLQTFCGVRTADLETSSFTQAGTDAPEVLSMWVTEPRAIASLISGAESSQASLERSVLGLLRQTRDGKWTVRIRSTVQSGTTVALTTPDFQSFTPEPTVETAFSSTKVFYAYDVGMGTWQVQTAEDLRAKYLLETEDHAELYTFLTDDGDAAILAQRFQLMAGGVRQTIPFVERGAKLWAAIVGDLVSVSYTPAPTRSGMLDQESFELAELSKAIAPIPEIRGTFRDVRGLGGRGWQWADDSAADDWDGASALEQALDGFWADDDGKIDPMDADTANLKVWG